MTTRRALLEATEKQLIRLSEDLVEDREFGLAGTTVAMLQLGESLLDDLVTSGVEERRIRVPEPPKSPPLSSVDHDEG